LQPPPLLLLLLLQGSMHALSKLSKLTQLQQFCFDALVADDPQHVALFDNKVLRCAKGATSSGHVSC
jgi:hypothetical protein